MPNNRQTVIPSIEWLRDYRKDWFRSDVIAGLTAAAVVVPKAMAYATIAGLPVQIGLYTAFVPMVIYALLGTSRPLSVSTTTTIAILTAAELGAVAPGGGTAELTAAGATLAVLVGAMLVVASVLRFGFIANFISEPVLTGFKSAIGLVIVVDQLPKLLGVHIDKSGFFRDILAIVSQLPRTSLVTFVLAVVVLVLIFGLERFAPRAPAPLVALAVAIIASGLFGLQGAGVAIVGSIPTGLPAVAWPNLDLIEIMWPGAAGIALMSFTEGIAAARAFSTPQEPRLVPNQELAAVGLANVAGGFFGAMPAGGGTSQTAINRRAGARTQLAELVTAAGAVVTLLLLAPVIALLPQAALAAVVVAYSVDLIRPVEFYDIRHVRRTEFYWAIAAFAGVVLLGTLKGILVAVIVSLVALVHQAYNPPVYMLGRKRGTNVFRALSREHPDDETWPGLLMLRTEGRVFFANAQRIGDQMWPLVKQAQPSVVLIDCSAVFDIEYTALKMLTEAEAKLRADGIELWLAALNPEVLDMVRHSKLGELLGHQRLFFNLQVAVENYRQTGPGPAAGPNPRTSPGHDTLTETKP
ncbi:MAG TPA: SulP family inorganic anion transporter [Candidatus Methylomirabilis sp.]|nr:SulP family inorganic anion transporter [Candidatus Methylomirabilis sp.]